MCVPHKPPRSGLLLQTIKPLRSSSNPNTHVKAGFILFYHLPFHWKGMKGVLQFNQSSQKKDNLGSVLTSQETYLYVHDSSKQELKPFTTFEGEICFSLCMLWSTHNSLPRMVPMVMTVFWICWNNVCLDGTQEKVSILVWNGKAPTLIQYTADLVQQM
jgi:hypothetical protein